MQMAGADLRLVARPCAGSNPCFWVSVRISLRIHLHRADSPASRLQLPFRQAPCKGSVRYSLSEVLSHHLHWGASSINIPPGVRASCRSSWHSDVDDSAWAGRRFYPRRWRWLIFSVPLEGPYYNYLIRNYRRMDIEWLIGSVPVKRPLQAKGLHCRESPEPPIKPHLPGAPAPYGCHAASAPGS